MCMPAEQGLSVLYVLADQWLRERQMAEGLGVKDPAPLDALVGRERVGTDGPDEAQPQRAALIRSMGGEVG